MLNKRNKVIVFLAATCLLLVIFLSWTKNKNQRPITPESVSTSKTEVTQGVAEQPSISQTKEEFPPMAIEALSQREFKGDDFNIEQTLPDGTNYHQYVVSYKSEGLKIYGLLTVPLAPKPEKGFPAIVFVHGYIPPKQYSTTGSYPTYQATLARAGFVTFKPDLRGHGNSEGDPVEAHFSEKYLVDTLYAIAYLKNYKAVDPDKIGYWGHSNGGEIGLRTIVVNQDIKAAVLWAGVVGSYQDMLETYNDKIHFLRNSENPLIKEHGLPSENPQFWNQIDPYAYLDKITAPVQLHHSTTDDGGVPIELSRHLKTALEEAGKQVELFEYENDDHNISKNSGLAWQRTIKFFKDNL